MTLAITYGVPTARSGVSVRHAIERGMFAAAGLDVTLQVVFGGPEIAALYDSGALPLGEMGSPPALTAMARGARFRIVGTAPQRGAGQFLVVRPEIADWEGLRGRTLGALSTGSCSYWFLRQILEQHGLQPDRDVHIAALGHDHARQLELVEEGRIDGVLTAEPYAAEGEHIGLVRVWGHVNELGEVPDLQWGLQVANVATLAAEPALVRTVRDIVNDATAYLAAHLDEWADLLARHAALPLAVARRAVERERPFVAHDGRLNLPGLDAAIVLQRRLGAIDGLPPRSAFLADMAT